MASIHDVILKWRLHSQAFTIPGSLEILKVNQQTLYKKLTVLAFVIIIFESHYFSFLL